MSDIKYRAWHKKLQRMYPVLGIDFAQKMVACPCQDGCETGTDGFSFDEVELLQCTGLKDRKGVEIYDGDIVRINHPADLTGDFTDALGVVWWNEEEAAYYHSNNHGRPPKRMWAYVEVIGNYYEHPDLADQLKQA
jgi:uncharacterized phage protein (TIGR01671 family)